MMAFLPKPGYEVVDRDWVTGGLAEALNDAYHAEEPEKRCNYHKLLRNGHQGRIPMRVKDGKILLHRSTAETFEGAAIGNPSRIESPDVALTVKQGKLFDSLRDRIGVQYDDVLYRLINDKGALVILAYPVVNDMVAKPNKYPVANLTG
jgi:hypothetical protein